MQLFLKSGIVAKNDEKGLYSPNILNTSAIMFVSQVQTTCLVCNRVKNIVKFDVVLTVHRR
jgi:hypothetical protein